MADAALFYGSNSGRNCDKFTEHPTPTSPATAIDSVLLDAAVANFECTLESQTIAGDHTIFIGKIVASHTNTEPKKRLYILATGHKLGAVS